jgi:hypothetical protein
MADFDTNFWLGNGAGTPTDYSSQNYAPNWNPTPMDYAGSYYPSGNINYNQPTYYDQYAGYAPDWGSSSSSGFMPGEMVSPDGGGWFNGVLGKVSDWMSAPAEGQQTNGGSLASAAVNGLGGLALGLMQSKALEKANKKRAKQDEERQRNAGKVAAQQKLDYINAMRADPNYREFDVQAPTRTVTANPVTAGYGQTGGEHTYFDPEFLSKVKAVPVAYAEGGLATTSPRNQQQQDSPDIMGFVRYLMRGGRMLGDVPTTPNNNLSEYMRGVSTKTEDEIRRQTEGYAAGGLSQLVGGAGGGQDDMVEARLSPGEYVMDAETVSALGDGSTEAGAAALDKMRQNLRSHKRKAPKSKIPPKAKKPEGYL